MYEGAKLEGLPLDRFTVRVIPVHPLLSPQEAVP
jgi:hypothetical protein